MGIVALLVLIAVVVIVVAVLSKSIHLIGPAQIGLVTKRFALRKLPADNPLAFHGEAGYQARTLMPGLRVRLWPLFAVQKYPWVQVPAGEIGVVIAQVGDPLPIGAKSGVYKSEFANFADLDGFIAGGGQKGVQRPVLPPGTLLPIHPVAFLVLTANAVFGLPVSREINAVADANRGVITPQSFGLSVDQLRVTVITPQGPNDVIGIVTVLEGEPLPSGDIASRLGGFDDVLEMETPAPDKAVTSDASVIELLLGNKNGEHNNYQDFQRFLDSGGKIGLQHDPLLYGAYLLNPFLVRVELVPMLVVNQGEVAVIKAFVGLPTLDMSGVEFKFGSIVRPGHRGIWQEPLRTGKYPINPRCYAAEIVPTSILTLNWSRETSAAHGLDSQLAPIEGKSREGFVFAIELQVQIHVPDTKAPKVISMVGTMLNLVNEVLQSAVGNHFRNTLQDQPAITFIETRMQVQISAFQHITEYLQLYEVETKGVYIQNVAFPPELVDVLTKREIANQQKATFEEQRNAETARIEMEKARGTADMQGQLASSQVNIAINGNRADAREEEARGEAAYVELTGKAEATKVEAIGLANAKATEALGIARAQGFEKQVTALGQGATAVVAVANAVSEGHITVVPEVLVTGGGGSFEGLAATLMRSFGNGNGDGGNGAAAKLARAVGGDDAPAPGASTTPDSVDELVAETEAPIPGAAIPDDPRPDDPRAET